MSELKLDISPADETAGSSFEVPDYSVASEDQPYVDRVLAMDPISDVPSPVEVKGRIAVPAELSLSNLPRDLQEEVERKLAMVPASKKDESRREFILEAYRTNSARLRGTAGVGADALPYHRALGELSVQTRQLLQEWNRLEVAKEEVAHWDSRFNEATGKMEPFPLLRMGPEQRAAAEARQKEIGYHVQLLNGIEGQRRLEKAMQETVALLKAREAAAADEAEIARRVDREEREARINARVQTKLRHRGAEVKG